MTVYEKIESKIRVLRMVAFKCWNNDKLDMATLWAKKAYELKWNLDHMSIVEAESNA